jgi:hypothetical protein
MLGTSRVFLETPSLWFGGVSGCQRTTEGEWTEAGWRATDEQDYDIWVF